MHMSDSATSICRSLAERLVVPDAMIDACIEAIDCKMQVVDLTSACPSVTVSGDGRRRTPPVFVKFELIAELFIVSFQKRRSCSVERVVRARRGFERRTSEGSWQKDIWEGLKPQGFEGLNLRTLRGTR